MNLQTKLPEQFTFREQPYGTVVLGNLKLEPNESVKDHFNLVGTCISGVQATALMCGVVHATRDKTGRSFTVYGITEYELERAEATRAYCG